jgi:hypothetical protein
MNCQDAKDAKKRKGETKRKRRGSWLWSPPGRSYSYAFFASFASLVSLQFSLLHEIQKQEP